MTTDDKIAISAAIEEITKNFKDKPWTENVKSLKEDFDINSLNSPNQYLKTIDELKEILREARLLFIYSVLNKVCREEGKQYDFATPYQANIQYNAVMKKEDSFYIKDEDGDWVNVFTSEGFMQFIDDLYWELYE